MLKMLLELNLFKNDSKNWTILTQPFLNLFISLKKLDLFSCLEELNFFYDSQNWTLVYNLTHRIEPLCTIWLTQLYPFSMNMSHRIEPFMDDSKNGFKKNSKNWTLSKIDSKNWTFKKKIKDLNPLFLIDSKNWALLFNMFLRMKPSYNMTHSQNSKNWTFFQYDSKNCLFFFNVTRRIEPSFLNVSMNWTLL